MIAFGKVIPLLLAYSVEKLPKILNFCSAICLFVDHCSALNYFFAEN